jgi:hypothetical protein
VHQNAPSSSFYFQQSSLRETEALALKLDRLNNAKSMAHCSAAKQVLELEPRDRCNAILETQGFTSATAEPD